MASKKGINHDWKWKFESERKEIFLITVAEPKFIKVRSYSTHMSCTLTVLQTEKILAFCPNPSKPCNSLVFVQFRWNKLQLDGYWELRNLELTNNWTESLRTDGMDDFAGWTELLKQNGYQKDQYGAWKKILSSSAAEAGPS